MSWTVKPTGDMTLSILDDDGFQILKVDMLGAGTLKAGTDGDILVRTLNDLQVIANFYEKDYDISDDNLKFPGDGLSPLPWSVQFNPQKRNLAVKSSKKKIADRVYAASVPEERVQEIVQIITDGVNAINVNS